MVKFQPMVPQILRPPQHLPICERNTTQAALAMQEQGVCVDVYGLCYHQTLFRHPWSGLLPGAMLIFKGFAELTQPLNGCGRQWSWPHQLIAVALCRPGPAPHLGSTAVLRPNPGGIDVGEQA